MFQVRCGAMGFFQYKKCAVAQKTLKKISIYVNKQVNHVQSEVADEAVLSKGLSFFFAMEEK